MVSKIYKFIDKEKKTNKTYSPPVNIKRHNLTNCVGQLVSTSKKFILNIYDYDANNFGTCKGMDIKIKKIIP